MERANGEGFRDKGGGIMGAYSARQIFFCLLNEGEMDLILEKQMCFLLCRINKLFLTHMASEN